LGLIDVLRVGRGERGPRTANQTPYLEDEDGEHEGAFQGEEFECFAPGGLESGDGKEEGGAVPADGVEAVEFIGNFWDGGCDYGL
jgi:hypothetical protein